MFCASLAAICPTETTVRPTEQTFTYAESAFYWTWGIGCADGLPSVQLEHRFRHLAPCVAGFERCADRWDLCLSAAKTVHQHRISLVESVSALNMLLVFDHDAVGTGRYRGALIQYASENSEERRVLIRSKC